MPPLHHEILTARVAVDREPTCATAQAELERVLAELDARLRAVAGRPRRDRRVGAARTSTGSSPDARSAISRTTAARASRCCFDAERFPSDPGDTRLEAERRRDPPALRHARAHRRREEAHPRLRSSSTLTSIRRGFAGGGFEGGAVAAEADGRGRADPRSRPDPRRRPSSSSASRRRSAPGWGRARSRTSRRSATSTSAAATTSGRHAHAPLAHPRGRRGVVSQLRLRRAGRDGVQAEPEREAGDADRAAGAEGRLDARPTCTATTAARAGSATARDPDDLAPAARRRRATTERST